jgi:hypothetical protein
MTREFTSTPAVRTATPLFIGIFAPTGAGKTCSALRLAAGIQRIVGGDIAGIDTESRRMLHFADQFKFNHIPFAAPFSPLDYLEAIEFAVTKGAKTIIIDSATHEHEGEGGVLEWHARETTRLATAWKCSEEKAQMSAWKEPKQARRRMIARLLQINVNFVFCFRAREKLKVISGRPPVDLGFMPIGAEELFFEMTLGCLLLPMAKGIPNWTSDLIGEKAMMKLPGQFESIFKEPAQLSEDIGQKLAEWAAGSKPPTSLPKEQVEAMINSLDVKTLPELTAAFEVAYKRCGAAKDIAARDRVKAAYDLVKVNLSTSTQQQAAL